MELFSWQKRPLYAASILPKSRVSDADRTNTHMTQYQFQKQFYNRFRPKDDICENFHKFLIRPPYETFFPLYGPQTQANLQKIWYNIKKTPIFCQKYSKKLAKTNKICYNIKKNLIFSRKNYPKTKEIHAKSSLFPQKPAQNPLFY